MVKINPTERFRQPWHTIANWWRRGVQNVHGCVQSGGVAFRADTEFGATGICLPVSCASSQDNLFASDVILNDFHGLSHRCGRRCRVIELRRVSSWQEIQFSVAIVGYPRSGSTALYNHLVLNENAKSLISEVRNRAAAFNLSSQAPYSFKSEDNCFGLNSDNHFVAMNSSSERCDSTKIVGSVEEDWSFFAFGWQFFPFTTQVADMNMEHRTFNQRRAELSYNTSRSGGMLLKQAAIMLDPWVFGRIVLIPHAKIIVQISDMARVLDKLTLDCSWFVGDGSPINFHGNAIGSALDGNPASIGLDVTHIDVGEHRWTNRDSVSAEHFCGRTDINISCSRGRIQWSPRHNRDGQLVLESLNRQCIFDYAQSCQFPDIVFKMQQLDPLILDRMFVLHKDFLEIHPDKAMRSLETFLGIQEQSLAPWPRHPTKSKWHTNFCQSSLRAELLLLFKSSDAFVSDLLSARGMWVPPILAPGRSSCET